MSGYTGFKKILDAPDRNGSPQPEFETDESRSCFITRLFIHEGFKKNDKLQESRPSSSQAVTEKKKIRIILYIDWPEKRLRLAFDFPQAFLSGMFMVVMVGAALLS